MPRPADVTDEQIAKWLEGFDERRAGVLKMTPAIIEGSKQAWCAGFWLEEKLQAETELSPEQVRSICTANGQVCFGRDAWKVSETTLFLIKHGAKLKPGPELAEALNFGKMDGIYGPGPGFHSRDAMRRLKEAMGIERIEEVIGLAGASSAAEAKEKLRVEIEELEQEFIK